MIPFLLILSISLSVLVSPEVQVLLGNSVGLTGVYFYPTMLVMIGASYFTLRGYGKIHEDQSVLAQRERSWLPLTLFFASRFVFFVTASTIVLATAGYVFNEVFVSSFPNFGFAFLVLGLVVFVNVIGGKVPQYVQFCLICLWLCGMLYLVSHGIVADVHPKAGGESHFSYHGLFLPFLLMIGFEFALVYHSKSNVQITTLKLWLGFITVILLLFCWGWIMGKMVSLDTLGSSYIPHTKAARRLLGDPGRMALGMAMIVGSAALVNGVLQVLVLQIQELFTRSFSRKKWPVSPWFPRILAFIVGITPGLMMAKGMAGYDITEVYIRGALIFWLLHYCWINYLSIGYSSMGLKICHGLTVLLLFLVCVGLVYFNEGSLELLSTLGYIGVFAGLCAGFFQFLRLRNTVSSS